MLLALSGYDEKRLQAASVAGHWGLRTANAWAWAGIAMCGVAAGLLVLECGAGVAFAAAACLGTVGLIGALQAYGMATISLMPTDSASVPPRVHALKRLGLAAILATVCLIFTQPFVLTWAVGALGGSLPVANEIRAQFETSQRKQRGELVQRDLALLESQLQRIGQPLPAPVAAPAEVAASGSLPPKTLPALASSVRRRALLIGNNDYRTSPLQGSIYDATQLHKALLRLGFEAKIVIDANRQAMELAIDQYVNDLKPGDLSLFYFSGHGFQTKGSNYLVPIDYLSDPEATLPRATSLALTVEAISRRKPLASIIAVDACRSPLSGAAKEGLAVLEAGINTYIAFAAGPGQVAIEVHPPNRPSYGLFTDALVRYLDQPVDVDQLFRQVRTDVAAASKGKYPEGKIQETWTQHNLTTPIVLATGSKAPAQAVASQTSRPSQTPIVSKPAGAASAPAGIDPWLGRLLPLQLSDGSQVCALHASRIGLTEEVAISMYSRCLKTQLTKLQDDLKELQVPQNLEAGAGDGSTNAGPAARSAMFAFRSAWADPAVPLILSALCFALMAGGMVWRALLGSPHAAYLEALHQAQRDAVVRWAQGSWTVARQFRFGPGEEHLRRRILDRLGLQEPTALPTASLEQFLAFLEGKDEERTEEAVPA